MYVETAETAVVREKLEKLAIDNKLQAEIDAIGMDVATSYTLADAIREGSTATDQAFDWGRGGNACALTAGYLAAQARGYIKQ